MLNNSSPVKFEGFSNLYFKKLNSSILEHFYCFWAYGIRFRGENFRKESCIVGAFTQTQFPISARAHLIHESNTVGRSHQLRYTPTRIENGRNEIIFQ